MRIETLKKKTELLEQAFLSSAGPCYSINLSKNLVPGAMHQKLNGRKSSINEEYGLPENVKFTELVSYWAKRLPKEEQEKYLEVFEISNLLEKFRKGENHVCHRFWTGTALAESILAERHLVMFQDEDSEEIWAISYILDLSEHFLEVLCQDYTSVYHVNLLENAAVLLKLEAGANASQMAAIRLRKPVDYTEQMKVYCENYIVKANQSEFLRVMDRSYLLEEMKEVSRYVHRYQSVPNLKGYQYFEVQILRLNDSLEDGNVIIAFRHIDEIVSAEQKHQLELEVRLEQEWSQLSALSKIYYAIFRIDLEEDSYIEVTSDSEVYHLTGKSGCASLEMQELCEHFVVPEHQERISRFFNVRTLAKRLWNRESIAEEYLAQDGNWHHACFIVKRRNDQGKVTHVLYVTRLITEEKQREEKLISIADTAKDANEAKSEFISQIAHDIRTPLNAMFGFLEIAQASLDNQEKLEYSLGKIRIAGEFLKDLVNDVLDLSRMEHGKLKIQSEKISLSQLLEELSVQMEQSQTGRTLNFNCHIHDIKKDCIFADPLRIKQIYSNVLSNAIKYTPDHGMVGFEVYQEPLLERSRIRVTAIITDTGIGMSEEFMKKMFSKFERGTDTRINTVSGYGLGLSIVKQLVELMKGTIEVSSAPGKGTRFCIKLDVPVMAEGIPEKKTGEMDYAEICRGMHLLVAEDNEMNREVITELLRMNQITCDCAENGLICIERFQNAPAGTYDAILMDVQMPKLDGIETARRIRSLDLPEAGQIPILAMTANALKSDIKNCLEAGMNRHLSKPVDMKKLLKALAEEKLFR